MRYFNILRLLALTAGVLTAHAAETPVPINNAGFEGAYQALPAGGTVTGATAPWWTHNSGFGDTTTVYAQANEIWD